jgi:lipopolysaccharide biosynthesis protein
MIPLLKIKKAMLTKCRCRSIDVLIQKIKKKAFFVYAKIKKNFIKKHFYDANCVVYQFCEFEKKNVLLFVVYSPTGILSLLQEMMTQQYMDAGYHVVLIVNTDNFYQSKKYKYPDVHCVVVRENKGYDFAAWAQAFSVCQGLEKACTISFVNDSFVLKERGAISLRDKAFSVSADVVYATLSSELKFHGQSYFFMINQFFEKKFMVEFFKKMPSYVLKEDVIINCELNLVDFFISRGLSVEGMYHTLEMLKEKINPTIRCWKELIALGCPFIKLQLFSGHQLKDTAPEAVEFLGEKISSSVKPHLEMRFR